MNFIAKFTSGKCLQVLYLPQDYVDPCDQNFTQYSIHFKIVLVFCITKWNLKKCLKE